VSACGLGEGLEAPEHRVLRQEQLAQRMGTTQSVIARLEAGGSPPSLRTLDRLADVLEADLTVRFTACAS
jgi:transcriptional regulator with XRE-family HTH domain